MNINKNYFLILIITLITFSSIYSFTITTYDDGTSSGNFTFSSIESKYKNLSINKDANITSATIDLTGYLSLSHCLQEFANESENGCGLSTGIYYDAEGWSNIVNIYDGNYSTSGSSNTEDTRFFYINYSIPPDAINATWVVKDEGAKINLSLPSNCFNNANLSLRIQNNKPGNNIQWHCWNGSSFISLRTYSDSRSAYEEAIWWFFSGGNSLGIDSFPTNLTIRTNNEITYQNSSFNDSIDNLDLNASSLQSCIDSCSNPSGNDCLCELNFTSYSGILEYSDINITWDDIRSPTWQNNKTNNTSPKINDSMQFNITWVDGVNTSALILSWNCTSSEFINITTISIENNNVTFIFNETLNYTKDIETCAWKFHANDSSNNWNVTDTWLINIDKQNPNVTSVAISPSPANDTNDLNCTYIYIDADDDTESNQWFRWYSNNSLTGNTSQVLGKGNITGGDKWICSVIVYDGFANSSWINSSELTLNDSTLPTITNASISKTSWFSDETVNITVNCSDISSSISFVRLTLNTSTTHENKSMTAGAGNLYYYASTLGVANYNIPFTYCQDSSGNLAKNNDTLSFTVSTRPTPPPPPTSGNGGSSGGVVVQTEIGNFTITTDTGGDSYSIIPARGEELIKPICITNTASDTLDFRMRCEDGTENQSVGVCDWVNLSRTTLTVIPNPDLRKCVDVYIIIPKDAEIKDYSFAIVTEVTTKDITGKGSIGFTLSVSRFVGYLLMAGRKLLKTFYIIEPKIEGSEEIKIPIILPVIGITILAGLFVWLLSQTWGVRWILLISIPSLIFYGIKQLINRLLGKKYNKEEFWKFMAKSGVIGAVFMSFILSSIFIQPL